MNSSKTASNQTKITGKKSPAQKEPQATPAVSASPFKIPMPKHTLVATPAELLPVRIAGMAFYVTNLEAQRKWYETMLGLKVYRIYEREGVVFEYVMVSPGGNTALALMTSMRPPGYNSCSRLILEVPNARALAEHIHSQGSSMSVAAKNIAYMVMDPEGNQIEIFNSRLPEPASSKKS